MKNTKLFRSLMACVLSASMLFGTCATSFAATEDRFEGGTINYVSLGASNVNGYGLDGYLPEGTTAENKATANVFGYRRCPEGGYVDLVADDLESRGYAVNTSQLAISSMRVEELRVLLDASYNGDAYTAWRFTGPGKWFENAAVTGGLETLRADYATSIESADLITVDIGVNNFGVYLSNQLSSNGTAYDDDLGLIDPELADTYDRAKSYVYELIKEHAGEHSAEVSELEFVVDAMAYALAGFCVNFDIVMEKIYALNPDVTVVTVSIQNLMEGLEATIPGVEGVIPFGEVFGALVDAANLYIAAGSPYSDDYLFADVSENGRVEFFLDQLLAYDGNPATLDGDMRDCFDVYDDDLMVSARVDIMAAEYVIGMINDAFGDGAANLLYGATGNDLIAAVIEDANNDFAIVNLAQPGAGAMLSPVFTTIKPAVLEAAYDVVAEIMQLGAKNDVLDLGVVLAGGYGSVEDALLEAVAAEFTTVAEAVAANPTAPFEYSIDEDFFNDIAEAASAPALPVPESLVSTVAALGIRTGIGNSFYGHPNRNGHIQIKNSVMNALDNDVSGLDVIKDRLGITAEDEAYVNEIIAKIKEIVEVVDATSPEEVKAEIKAYVEACIEELKVKYNITDEQSAEIKAKIDEIIAEIEAKDIEEIKTEIVAEIEAYIAELKAEAKAEIETALTELKEKVELEIAKVGHKPYEAKEGSYYVAVGNNTVYGTGIGRDDDTYYDLIADELDVDTVAFADKNLPIIDLVKANAVEVAKADLITYQADASSLVTALISLLSGTPDWNKYIDAETQAVVEDILAKTTEILTADWEAYADMEIAEIVPEIRDEIVLYIPEDAAGAEEYIDEFLTKCVEYVQTAVVLVSEKKDVVVAEMAAIDEQVIDLAEKVAYVCVAYAMDTVEAVETIQTINPDATLVVVGMYNPVKDLNITVDGETIDIGEIFEYVIDATNLYYAGYTAFNGEISFVDISDAETNGFASVGAIDIEAMDAGQLGTTMMNLTDNMHANVGGHVYIKDQIIDSFKCTPDAYEAIDEEYHMILCSICGKEHGKEAHDFVKDTCSKCGYVPTPDPTVEPTATPGPTRRPSGGSSGSNVCVVKFETNDGSKVSSVTVAKGQTIAEPEAPVKEGFAFAGWYTDKNFEDSYDFSSAVTKSFTLYAKWDKVVKEWANPFTDVTADKWYYEWIRQAVENGLMNGVSGTEFAPEMNLTRGMFVTILYRLEGEPEMINKSIPFADVSTDAYYANAVSWAAQNGIVTGYTDTEFAPNDNVTREQMATMIARYADFKEMDVEVEDLTYTDSDSISDYAKEAVKVAKALEILVGNDDGTFAPQRNATRAEAAALFVRLLNVVK